MCANNECVFSGSHIPDHQSRIGFVLLVKGGCTILEIAYKMIFFSKSIERCNFRVEYVSMSFSVGFYQNTHFYRLNLKRIGGVSEFFFH